MASVEVVPNQRSVSDAPDPRAQAEIDSLMRRFFEQRSPEPPDLDMVPASEVVVASDRPRRDFDMACGLLERASEAFDLLVNRCQRL